MSSNWQGDSVLRPRCSAPSFRVWGSWGHSVGISLRLVASSLNVQNLLSELQTVAFWTLAIRTEHKSNVVEHKSITTTGKEGCRRPHVPGQTVQKGSHVKLREMGGLEEKGERIILGKAIGNLTRMDLQAESVRPPSLWKPNWGMSFKSPL